MHVRWTNTSRDMLVCSHPSCRAAVCVAYHPVLSSRSVSRLTATYREMLATSHDRACPFRDEAERWLRDDRARVRTTPRKIREREFVVPPYLLPMSEEFLLLESAGCGGGTATRRMVGKAASHLTERLNSAAPGKSLNGLTLPAEVMNFVTKECSLPNDETLTIESVAENIRSAIGMKMEPGQGRSNGTVIEPKSLDNSLYDSPCASKEAHNVTDNNCALLAAFGWRDSKEDVLVSGHFIVECGVCMAKGAVPAGDCARDCTDEPLTKKRRTQGSDIKTIDLIASHRSFCPYACGFVTAVRFESDGTASANGGGPSVQGWKIVLATLLRDTKGGSDDSSTETDKIYSSVRNMLRLAFSP
mmetsp:Transcript_37091/g.111093  ORF Transcript_37091/g.111093 Transcript_37091/m.111093 type:complete len:359 (-) Transcript_37091:147-1223(-)|eukprot:CAMPEP_0113532620 /NCGR_PEP_ID=MMETSP0015_2-20120614/4161_1 /TAXON_ID=2838 /ORGANISM="Odontella" /LENGTH=358 /DNA_ID=CAMNT_0000431603 /DNA_START=479 /DNA_END=1555 /DNA_ORIENTATION=+ /assembly_acc=CAM_ASM_000160